MKERLSHTEKFQMDNPMMANSNSNIQNSNIQNSVIQQSASNQTVIIQQPQAVPIFNQKRAWSSSLCSCFDDCESCLCVEFCLPCYAAYMFSLYGECCCSYCLVPEAHLVLRVQHRNRHRIQGSMLDDCLVTHCCLACSLCQIKRDMNYVMSEGDSLF